MQFALLEMLKAADQSRTAVGHFNVSDSGAMRQHERKLGRAPRSSTVNLHAFTEVWRPLLQIPSWSATEQGSIFGIRVQGVFRVFCPCRRDYRLISARSAPVQ